MAVQSYANGIIVTKTFDQLEATGSTSSICVTPCNNHTIQYTIATINTNVVTRIEGSLDGTNWFALVSDVTDTANGTYFHQFTGKIKEIRFTFVSEADGTNATIDAVYLGG